MALVPRAPALDVCHMILVPTYSPCALRGDALLIDRKLHTGICEYVEGLGCAVTVLAPALSASDRLMDGVELQVASLPYRVAPVDCDGSFRVRDVDRARVRALVREADLVYGVGFGVAGLARRLKTPSVAVRALFRCFSPSAAAFRPLSAENKNLRFSSGKKITPLFFSGGNKQF